MVNAVTRNMPSDWNYSAYLNYADNRLEDCEWYFDFGLIFMLDLLYRWETLLWHSISSFGIA